MRKKKREKSKLKTKTQTNVVPTKKFGIPSIDNDDTPKQAIWEAQIPAPNSVWITGYWNCWRASHIPSYSIYQQILHYSLLFGFKLSSAGFAFCCEQLYNIVVYNIFGNNIILFIKINNIMNTQRWLHA